MSLSQGQVQDRVTSDEALPAELIKSSREKDPKKVADGRAGAHSPKAKQERLLREFRAAKKILLSDAERVAGHTHTALKGDIVHQETHSVTHAKNWNPWLSLSLSLYIYIYIPITTKSL